MSGNQWTEKIPLLERENSEDIKTLSRNQAAHLHNNPNNKMDIHKNEKRVYKLVLTGGK